MFKQDLDWIALEEKLQRLFVYPRYYILIDEFQSIFDSPHLLQVAEDFFRAISIRPAVSYVGVGTYKLMDLLIDVGGPPFNKATFIMIPLFNNNENCDPAGIIQPIQFREARL
ncbi:hypothetical protein BGX27_011309 [Mortierella sp. AM989]|nr:hypothetical protein BGX27_011309 [Mortierella sp. AM989]